jgi:hypothetical protein
MSDPNDDLTTHLKEAALAAARIAAELDPSEAIRRGTQLRHRARVRKWVLSSTVALGVVAIFLIPLPHLLLRHQASRPGATTSTRPGVVTTSTRPSTTTSTTPSNLASECASSVSECLPYPAAMTFADSSHGLILVEKCLPTVCQASVETSSDGGERWQPRRPFVSFPPSDLADFPGYPISNPNRHGVTAIDLADAVDGWAYGPGLFVTHDGGRRFHRVKVQASVIAVAAAGGTVWVLEQRCFLKHELNECARSVLLTGPIGGDTLTPVARQPPGFPLAQGYTAGTQFPTVIVHPGVDLVLASVPGLDLSTDSGRTWHQEVYPCRSPDLSSEGRTVSADPSGSLWLVCAGQSGGGYESKQLWRSFDGGQSWLGPYSLPSGGYGGVIAATSTVAWGPWNRAPIFHSTDGGHSWHPLLTGHFNGAFGGPAAFSDVGSDDAWAIDPLGQMPFPRTLYRTTNGGRSWSTVRLKA